ncbi:AAA family ATPase [Thermoflavimicrobium daqui]|uniref:YhaN AAA domain-containing protein n=1 Tax=Thermoflavimicrobium daqui TaxID=2137476 RepID=A0A364K5Z8_9BACL|nr:AAA family ATPase [Thermoflavimicrobium daqui]RAL25735.1 hypothetical protein DL897_06575 [Thermoflavimicrobium daqui]
MKIEKVKFQGFGRLIDKTFTFHEGINLIEAKNEVGKSTLVQGIFALLYGEKKEGLKTKRTTNWYEKYKPWGATEQYGGEITYSIGSDKYCLYRNLLIHKDIEQLTHLTRGEDWTERFPMDKKKDRLILEKQLGLSGDLFRQITFFTTYSLVPAQKKDRTETRVLEKLRSLLKKGEEVDLTTVKKKLESEIQEIGVKKDARQKPYGKLYQEINELEKRCKELEIAYQQQKKEEARIIELARECEKLYEKQTKIEKQAQRLLEEVQHQKNQLEIEKLIIQEQALKERIEQAHQLIQKRDQLKREREENQPTEWISLEEVNELRLTLREYKEKQLSLNEQLQKIEKLAAEQEKYKERNDKLIAMKVEEPERMLSKLATYEKWEYKLFHHKQENEDNERTWIEKDMKLVQQLQQKEEKIRGQLDEKWAKIQTEDRGTDKWWALIAGTGLITVILYILAPWIWLVTGVFTVFCSYWLWRKKIHKDEERKKLMELQLALQNNQVEQKKIFYTWQVENFLDLLEKHTKIKKREQTLQGKQLIEEEMEQIRQEVKNWLSDYVDKVPVFDVDKWEQMIIRLKQQREEILQRLFDYQATLSFLQKQYEKEQTEYHDLGRTIAYYQNHYQTSDLHQIEKWFEQSERVRKLDLKIDELEEQIELFAYDLPDWEEELKISQKTRAELQAQWRSLGKENLEQRLLDLEKERQQVLKQFQEKEKEKANLEGQVEVLRQKTNLLPKLQTELKALKSEWESLHYKRAAMETALTVLDESVEEVQENIMPYLLSYATRWIYNITEGKYERIFMEPQEKEWKVVVPESNEQKPIEQLSTGTIDQIYFALRLAMLELYSEMTKTFLPIILDDSFVHFDYDRLQKTLQLLLQLAKSHQIILCTCQKRERELLDKLKANYHLIALQEL